MDNPLQPKVETELEVSQEKIPEVMQILDQTMSTLMSRISDRIDELKEQIARTQDTDTLEILNNELTKRESTLAILGGGSVAVKSASESALSGDTTQAEELLAHGVLDPNSEVGLKEELEVIITEALKEDYLSIVRLKESANNAAQEASFLFALSQMGQKKSEYAGQIDALKAAASSYEAGQIGDEEMWDAINANVGELANLAMESLKRNDVMGTFVQIVRNNEGAVISPELLAMGISNTQDIMMHAMMSLLEGREGDNVETAYKLSKSLKKRTITSLIAGIRKM